MNTSLFEVKIIINSFIDFNEDITIEGINIAMEGQVAKGVVIIEADSIIVAEILANEKVDKVFNSLSFSMETKFEYFIISITQVDGQKSSGLNGLILKEEIRGIFTSEDLDQVHNIYEKLINTTDEGKKAFTYCIKGIGADSLDEAFLHFFKGIEFIANTYTDQAKSEKAEETEEELQMLVDKMKKTVERDDHKKIIKLSEQIRDIGFTEFRRKVKTCLQDLDLAEYVDHFRPLPGLRVAIAHGTGAQDVVSPEQLQICKEICKNVVLRYLDKQRRIE